MIKLKNINLGELEFYFEKVEKIIKDKIKEKINNKEKNEILELIDKNLEKFLKNEIDDNGKIKDLPKEFYNLKRSNLEFLKQIFDYENIIKRKYEKSKLRALILHKLNLKTCPYCDRQYITNYCVESEAKAQGQIDHFYSQSEYPELALNINNFVPSCSYCNQLKLNGSLAINPRKEEFGENGKFILTKEIEAIMDMNLKDIEIDIKALNEKVEKNINILKLRDIYEIHSDYVYQLIKDVNFEMNPYYLSSIEELFKDLNESKRNYLKELVLSPYKYRIKNNEPLGKLTKDILSFLKIE